MYVSLTPQEVELAYKLAMDIYERGHEAEFDNLKWTQGQVSITAENLAASDGTFVTIEFHKISDGKGLFGGQKSKWVSRLFTHPTKAKDSMTMHGCYEAIMLFQAFQRATQDVGKFVSKTKLEDYLQN